MGQLEYVDPPLRQLAQGVIARPALSNSQFSFDYETNTVALSRGLLTGERIRLDYSVIQSQPVAGNLCGSVAGGLETFTGRTDPLRGAGTIDFRTGDTIGSWLRRNIANRNGIAWLNGTDSEKALEFKHPLNPRNAQPIDRRLDIATAQFIAAGSFGMTQATTSLWTRVGPTGQAVLNTAFDLSSKCLWQLMTNPSPERELDAFAIAAAAHSYFKKSAQQPSTMDQIDWARYWSAVISNYNSAGPEYCSETINVIRDGKTVEICPAARDGVSHLVQTGLQRYCPECGTPPK